MLRQWGRMAWWHSGGGGGSAVHLQCWDQLDPCIARMVLPSDGLGFVGVISRSMQSKLWSTKLAQHLPGNWRRSHAIDPEEPDHGKCQQCKSFSFSLFTKRTWASLGCSKRVVFLLQPGEGNADTEGQPTARLCWGNPAICIGSGGGSSKKKHNLLIQSSNVFRTLVKLQLGSGTSSSTTGCSHSTVSNDRSVFRGR